MPDFSVIIPAYGHCPHLAGLIKEICAGTRLPREIIVSHSGPDTPTELETISDKVTVRHSEERLLGGAARNAGVGIARGDWFAFIDADVWPAPDWLERLTEAVQPGVFSVGAVGVAEPGGYWGMCNWMSEFSSMFPWMSAHRGANGASCNMMVSAADFKAAGGFPEDHQPGEDTLLFARLQKDGVSMVFTPSAVVRHFNHTGFAAFRGHQYKLGYHSALARKKMPLSGHLAVRYPILGLGIWLPRLALISIRTWRGGPLWVLRWLSFFPGLLIGSLIWAAGFLRGARTGKIG